MIGEDIRLEGFDARSWTNLVSLFLPRLESDLAAAPERSDVPETGEGEADGGAEGSLFVVRADDGRVLNALHSARGRVRGLEPFDLDALPELARRFRVRRCVVVAPGALEELNERIATRLQRGDDYVSQWLVLVRSFREVEDAGLVHVWPRPLANVPVPPAGAVRAAFDLVLPDEHAAVAMLWQGGRPWTAVALRRRAGRIDLVAGPDLIARWTGPLGGDWRRDARHVVDAVSRAAAPVHLGVFAEVGTLRRLLARPDAGAWLAASATRDLIVHPTPPYVAVALGADGVRAAAERSARWLGRLDPLGLFAPVTHYLRNRVHEIQSLTDTLGFNPLQALAAALATRDAEDAGAPAPDDGSDAKTTPDLLPDRNS